MNCHENKEKKTSQGHNPMKHMLHMILCCGLPIVIVGLLPLITKVSPGAAGVVSRIVPYLCPIMMISMMVMMIGGNKRKDCCSNTSGHDDKETAAEKQ
jgi:hypothetical protein